MGVTNTIIAGVRSALVLEFGEDVYDILTERPNGAVSDKSAGGEVKSCLFVTNRIPRAGNVKERLFSSRQLLGNRYVRSVGLCVEYRPACVRVNPSAKVRTEALQKEFADVVDRLFTCLEYIEVGEGGDVLRGQSMQGEYVDDVLNFYVSYDVFVEYGFGEPELMESLERVPIVVRG
ncbi:MAG: hypothetical protein FWG45_02295 [Oscillospiraceae bacterium]|nr:hypothetical protein [Oscillospiraceae bacterium]